MEARSAEATRANGPGWLRIVLIVGPAVLFVSVLSLALANRNGVPRPGDDAPGFSAPLLGGEGSLSLDGLRGKPVVLNFWASWCDPCEEEAPMLEEAYESYGDRVSFVGINIKDANSDALAFVDRYGIGYPNVRDEGSRIYDDYALTGQPESFFIDAEGTIVEHVPGPLFEDDLDRLLGELVASGG